MKNLSAFGLASASILVGVACSGSPTTIGGPSCGPGTVLEGSQCVPAGADGSTLSDSGMVGDTGSADALAISDGPANDSDSSATEGAPDGPGVTDAEVDAQADGGGWTDDPCPSTPPNVNCSTDCGGVNAACQEFTCRQLRNDVSSAPFIIRTPSHPAGPQTCNGCSINFSVEASILQAGEFPNGALVTVGPPWKITPTTPCGMGVEYNGCSYLPNGNGIVAVWTDDPNAPARNIVISAAAPGQKCP